MQDDKEVRDNSCRLFARNFFSALRAGRSIGESFGWLGRLTAAEILHHSQLTVCSKREGKDKKTS